MDEEKSEHESSGKQAARIKWTRAWSVSEKEADAITRYTADRLFEPIENHQFSGEAELSLQGKEVIVSQPRESRGKNKEFKISLACLKTIVTETDLRPEVRGLVSEENNRGESATYAVVVGKNQLRIAKMRSMVTVDIENIASIPFDRLREWEIIE